MIGSFLFCFIFFYFLTILKMVMSVKINLGYVSLPMTLNLTSSHALTYTNYEKMGEKLGNIRLHDIILSNLNSLEQILYYNLRNDVRFFRFTSNLIPLASHPLVSYDCYDAYQKQYLKIGNLVRISHMRVDFHPDQYCVLNSTRKDVVAASIRILKHHVKVSEMMHLDMKMVLHIGGGVYGKKAGMNRFMKTFRSLPLEIQSKIILENDDKLYNVEDVLTVCQMLNIPMVLDYHHHLCNSCDSSLTMLLPKIFDTWSKEKLPPKIHFSSPKSAKEFRSHSDYIAEKHFMEFLNMLKQYDKDVDIMLEVKKKDESLFRLIRQLKFYGYHVEGTTIYL